MWRVIALASSLLFGSVALGQPYPTPEYFGVYLVADGKLVELRQNSYDPSNSGIAFGGADLIRSISSVVVPTGEIELLLFTSSPPHVSGDRIITIARVAKSVTQEAWSTRSVRAGEGEDLNMWALAGEAAGLRFAPVPEAKMPGMVRGVPRSPLPPGVYGAIVNGNLFDFKVGPNPEASAPCLVRVAHFTGAEYQRCPRGVGAWEAPPETDSDRSPPPDGSHVADGQSSFSTTTSRQRWPEPRKVKSGSATFLVDVDSDLVLEASRTAMIEAGYTIFDADSSSGEIRGYRQHSSGELTWITTVTTDPGGRVKLALQRGTTRRFAPADVEDLLKYIIGTIPGVRIEDVHMSVD